MTTPVTPDPDYKDWTWVLERPCPDCGFDASSTAPDEVAGRLRAAIARLRAVLDGPDATVRTRPDVWSPLEYACHVRDGCIVYGARLALMRGTTDPHFPDWDQNATALSERYWEQHPERVSAELAVEGERLANDFASVRPDELGLSGRRSDGATFTVDTLGRYFLHDVVHHVHDVGAAEAPTG
jgi:hypothetical protein